ncbi:MAG: hypothetical protein N3B13_06620 [Deltaproteobacteria bacterium]|nr:hypothetical protein [Deltaproteobacteria bacterium]
MRNKIKIVFAFLVILMLFSACSTTVRSITHTRWEKDYAYFTYWEGTCKPILGCEKGKSVIKRCNYNDDNTAICVEETAAFEVLNPHLKK